MPRYTIIVEYAGGTYVSQVDAVDRGSAVRTWLADPDPGNSSSWFVHRNKPKRRAKLDRQLSHPDESLWALEDCENVWQTFFRIKKEEGSFHIVRTDPEIEGDC